MERFKPYRLQIAFALCFLIVGIPYWLIPYSKVSLPGTLIGPGLFAVAIAAVALRFYETGTFWKVVGLLTASAPAAVFARVMVDTLQDPTSHNLWPLEIILAAAVSFCFVLAGALLGQLLVKIIRN